MIHIVSQAFRAINRKAFFAVEAMDPSRHGESTLRVGDRCMMYEELIV